MNTFTFQKLFKNSIGSRNLTLEEKVAFVRVNFKIPPKPMFGSDQKERKIAIQDLMDLWLDYLTQEMYVCTAIATDHSELGDDFTLEFTIKRALDDTYHHMQLSKGDGDLPYVSVVRSKKNNEQEMNSQQILQNRIKSVEDIEVKLLN